MINDSYQDNERYVPGSPIFREERKTPPITPAPPSTPLSRAKGVAVCHQFQSQSHRQQHPATQSTLEHPCAMTVSVTNATQGATIVTTKTSASSSAVSNVSGTAASHCYTTTRSAAMMALTGSLGKRSKCPVSAGSPQLPHKSAAASVHTNAAVSQVNGIVGGTKSGGSGSSGSDNDSFNNSNSTTATALRRLYFKSGRSAKSKVSGTNAVSSSTCIPLNTLGGMGSTSCQEAVNATATHTSTGTGVPKVVIMGSSSASMADTTINTSTDSASTLVTSVTHTDASETCDSLDLGDTSGQSEPLFSSLEEPLLTAIQVDSEHDGTELELTSCSMYSRPDMNLQDSIESQESSLSILVGEPSSTTPLLASHNRTQHTNSSVSKQRAPSTAPAPISAASHFTFDPPKSPKSARSSEMSKSHFTFKDVPAANGRQSQQHMQSTASQSRRHLDRDEQNIHTTNFMGERKSSVSSRRDISPNSRSYMSHSAQRNEAYYDYAHEEDASNDRSRHKRSRTRDFSAASSNSRNRYSTGGTVIVGALKTSPKRESRRSPSSSKVNSAPPTMKESNFFAAKTTQLSPSSQQSADAQRKYSSSSSSGGSERTHNRERDRCKDITMFPFDREALDYERIQRECFAVDEHASSTTSSSDSEGGHCSVYERKLSLHHGSPKSSDIFQQYTLLSQQEQHVKNVGNAGGGLPTRKNSKRIRPDSALNSNLAREQVREMVPKDAFYPQPNTSSPGELDHAQYSPKSYAEVNKFDEIASKFDQIPPKQGSSGCLHPGSNGGRNAANQSSPTGSLRGGTPPPPLPDLRVDFFSEVKMEPHKKSFKNKSTAMAVTTTTAASDDLDDCQRAVSGATASSSINVTPNPLETAVCTQPRATIVVQQPSLSLDSAVETMLIKSEEDFISVEQGKDLARKRNSQQLHSQQQQHKQQQQLRRDENMRQLLDVTNTLTFDELRDFEMRYGSPHHSRSQSVKTPGSRASGRPNQLCLPQQRSRVASMPNTGFEEQYYRLRHFSITGKGVVNRGDSLKSRRSRSNNSVASSNSSTEHLTTTQIPAPNSARTSATCSLASSRESSTSNPGSGPYRVLMLGGPAVGKSSLVSQFMTSEYLHAYDTSIDDDSGEKSVSVLLSGEESELIFIDHSYTEMTPDDCLGNYDPHGYCVIYSSSDRSSFTVAEHVLQVLWTNQNIAQKAVILVGNKADLARSRSVTSEDGKAMATAYDCKFIETSVGINHNVDELLVGLLSQIRLKLENPEKSRDLFRKRSIRKSKRRACSPLGGACLTSGTNPNTPLGPANNIITDVNSTPPSSAHSSPRKYRGSRTSTSLKVKGLLGRVWARDSKSKSCENLHVL